MAMLTEFYIALPYAQANQATKAMAARVSRDFA
jgi:hypothetical protein